MDFSVKQIARECQRKQGQCPESVVDESSFKVRLDREILSPFYFKNDGLLYTEVGLLERKTYNVVISTSYPYNNDILCLHHNIVCRNYDIVMSILQHSMSIFFV